MKVSARNQLKGIIKKINKGDVNVEVIIELGPGVEITSVITASSAEKLELDIGKQVYAVVKASHVMVGVDHD
ncbi:MAG: molybdopterin-binding protein [Bacteroidales bacterium]|nr:molybdopterin-binding protein [Bacteroidales bacterium]